MELEQLKESSFNVLGKNSIFKGDLYLEGHIRVSSSIEGKVTLSENAQLIIEKFGSISGEVIAHSIEIYGQYHGNLKCSGKVIIHTGSKVSGSIETQDLVIYPGSVVNIEGQTL